MSGHKNKKRKRLDIYDKYRCILKMPDLSKKRDRRDEKKPNASCSDNLFACLGKEILLTYA